MTAAAASGGPTSIRTDPLTVAARDLTDQHQTVPCRTDPDAWFAESAAMVAEAVEACGRCPVITQCRQAVEAHVAVYGSARTYGVWAGRHYWGDKQSTKGAVS